MKRTAAILSASLLAGCSFLGIRSGYEEPAYDVEEKLAGSIEVRRYEPRLAAEASVEAADPKKGRNAAFRLLFDYIRGANGDQQEIAMTTPVESKAEGQEIAMTVPVETNSTAGGSMRMRFFLPSDLMESGAPPPNDPRVELVEVPPETLAVLAFSGQGREEQVAAQKKKLLSALEQSAWHPTGEPVAYFYDPPWTLPFLRRNEVAVSVAK